jgi:hypothetical protein
LVGEPHALARSRRNDFMAKIIEFYVPPGFQKKQTAKVDLQKGKIIEFCATRSKSA